MASNTGRQIARTAVLLGALALAFWVLYGAYTTFYKRAYPTEYWKTVVREADRNGLPYDLVFAVIRTESGFRPQVQSSVGARGLMQLTEDTFDWTKSKMEDAGDETYADLFDPEVNIRYGCKLLRLLLDEFEAEDTALCAYHAGWGNAKKWLADDEHSADGINIHTIPFGDTRRYVQKINETRAIYRNLYQFVEHGG
ncbi:lytic transglycosylase domain-containing protein [Ligaoa zhengdingensis]|uniref:lytic transglycosylase domain-containing protein n=1 Tax=Ligaoa zhengdingensis TaxID=2763658 RepID=UPI0031BACBE0